MTSDPPPTLTPGQEAPANKTFSVGSLIYSRAGLLSLFGWLLWGDFVMVMMDAMMPTLLPLLLKTHGANNREIAFLCSTLFMVMNAVLNPVISYKSDRYRSRWGRRRPFIFVTTPFVVLFLAAIPFAPDILAGIKSISILDRLLSYSPVSPIILIFGLLVLGYHLFHLFIAALFSYLVPDVVPKDHVGRFIGLMRIVGTAGGMCYNYFILGIAETHMKSIFVLMALAYGFFILLMCWQVKEGDYPPPIAEPHEHWWSGIQNYARECFGHSYYWWVFLAYSALTWGSAGNVFMLFLYRDEWGLSLDLIGKTNAWCGFIFVFLAFPFGILLDRWGSHKMIFVATVGSTICSLLMFFFVIGQWSAITMIVIRGILWNLYGFSLGKWTIEIYPRDRYGQFGSAGALFSSVGSIVALSTSSWMMDLIKVYRYYFIWNAVFGVISLVATVIVYRRWKSYGGPDNYQAP